MNDLLGAALRCPLCGEPLAVVGNSLVCAGARRHTYDMARTGYVNLNTHLPQSGDTAEMAAARQAFLRRGYYAPLADALVRTAQAHTPDTSLLCDAGCGEGYYTEAVGAGFAAVLGADLSKYALALAGKSAKHGGERLRPAAHRQHMRLRDERICPDRRRRGFPRAEAGRRTPDGSRRA